MWVSQDNFNDYGVGNSIGSCTGGFGWTSGWTLGAGTITTETAPSGMSTVALRCNDTGGNNYVYRLVDEVSSGQLSFDLLSSITTGNAVSGVSLRNTSESTCIQVFFNNGNLVLSGKPSISEGFESYTTGTSLNGGSGGLGWNANWATGTGNITTETAPSGGEGSKSAQCTDTSGGSTATRTFDGFTVGTITLKMRESITNPNQVCGFSIRNGSAAKVAQVFFDTSGNISDDSGNTFKSSYSANTWYTVAVEFDATNQPNKYRVTIDGGTPSSWITAINTFASINELRLEDYATNAHQTDWDGITNGVTPPVNLVTGFTANTVYSVTLDIDRANHQYRAKVNGGSYSSYIPEITDSNPTKFFFEDYNTNAHATWLDNIRGDGSPSNDGMLIPFLTTEWYTP